MHLQFRQLLKPKGLQVRTHLQFRQLLKPMSLHVRTHQQFRQVANPLSLQDQGLIGDLLARVISLFTEEKKLEDNLLANN